MAFRFFSVPLHRLAPHPAKIVSDEWLEPQLPEAFDAIERALHGSEYRDTRTLDRVRSLLQREDAATLGSPGEGFGPSAVFAQPPGDLPALLRLADQLERLSVEEVGERALVWQCSNCDTRYAVPVALVRPVSIRCERCGQPVELNPGRSQGEEPLMDPFQGTVNLIRKQLAPFFREAMARGWPVLVSKPS